MGDHSNEFTKWCVSSGLTKDKCPTRTLIEGVQWMLKDAAGVKTGYELSKITYSKLERRGKPDLIRLVQTYSWFCDQVVMRVLREKEEDRIRFDAAGLSTKHTDTEKKLKEMTEKVQTLQDSLISSQKILVDCQEEVISLQKDLLAEKSQKIEETVSSVKEQLTSYSDVIKKSCSSSLAPRKIQEAMKKASSAEDRSTNLIVYGLDECNEEENTEEVVLSVLQHTNEKPKVVSCRRLGAKVEGKRRPVKVVLHNRDMVRSILARSGMLREVEGMSQVYICPDRTVDERSERNRLVSELKKQRETVPHVKWGIVRGSVVKRDEKD